MVFDTDAFYQDMRLHMQYTVCMSRKRVEIDIEDRIYTSMFPESQKIIMYVCYY